MRKNQGATNSKIDEVAKIIKVYGKIIALEDGITKNKKFYIYE